jgi:hypothetical protein
VLYYVLLSAYLTKRPLAPRALLTD